MRIGSTIPVCLAAAALALLSVSCGKEAPPPGAPPPPTVTVSQPVAREVTDWDEFPGRMDAVEAVDIKARVNGYLQSINFTDGAEVKKGDLLFVIDPRPYQDELNKAEADLGQAEARLEWTTNDLARAQRLLQTKAISEEETQSRLNNYRVAQAALASSTAAVETAKLNMEYSRITAPISGRIGRRMITVGNLVNGNQGQATSLATIVSLDPIYCYFDADEQSILKYQKLAHEEVGENIRDGKVVCELELGNETGFPHHGLLDFVDNQVDRATGTMRLRGVFPNPDRVLLPGLFARTRLPGSAKYQALLIPDQAVGTDQDVKYVLTVNETGGTNMVEYRPVKLGPIADGLRVVREGISSNDWVVVNGLMSARPGTKVNPTNAPIAAPPAPAGGEKN